MHAKVQGRGQVNRADMKETKSVSRRASITGMVAAPVVYQLQHTDGDAHADSTMCDAECEQMLSQQSPVQTDSGLQYKVIASGSGPMVQPGYQVVVHWVAFNQEGKEFENTLSNGQPRDVRITGTKERNVIAGLDEGISTMRVGEKRRFYIPGSYMRLYSFRSFDNIGFGITNFTNKGVCVCMLILFSSSSVYQVSLHILRG